MYAPKVLYVGEGLGAVVTGDANPFGETPSDEARPHEKKGGLRLNEYLTYNCLENQGSVLSHSHHQASDKSFTSNIF